MDGLWDAASQLMDRVTQAIAPPYGAMATQAYQAPVHYPYSDTYTDMPF